MGGTFQVKTDKVLVFLTVSSLAVLLSIYWAILEDQKRWEEFRKQNNCRQVSLMKNRALFVCEDGALLYR